VADIFGRLSRWGGWLTFVRVCVGFGLDLVGTCMCSTSSAEELSGDSGSRAGQSDLSHRNGLFRNLPYPMEE
jgi:hypothetical protein